MSNRLTLFENLKIILIFFKNIWIFAPKIAQILPMDDCTIDFSICK